MGHWAAGVCIRKKRDSLALARNNGNQRTCRWIEDEEEEELKESVKGERRRTMNYNQIRSVSPS